MEQSTRHWNRFVGCSSYVMGAEVEQHLLSFLADMEGRELARFSPRVNAGCKEMDEVQMHPSSSLKGAVVHNENDRAF